jgi:hypothetical protein
MAILPQKKGEFRGKSEKEVTIQKERY